MRTRGPLSGIVPIVASASLLLAAVPAAAQCTSTLTGSTATMICGDASDELTIEVDAGNAVHSRFTSGDGGFASDSDWDSATGGVQTLANGGGNQITIDAGGGDDTVTFKIDGGLTGSLAATGGAGNDSVVVDGGSDARTFAWNGSKLTGTFDVTFECKPESESLTIVQRASTNITVTAGTGPPSISTLAVDAGDGNDSLIIGVPTLDSISYPIQFTGGGGNDTLQLDDSGDTTAFMTYSVNATQITRDGAGAVTYSGLESIVIDASASSSGDFVQVSGLPASTSLTVNGGDGNDAFSVGSPGSNSDGILGSLTLNGDGGTNNTLIVIDTADGSNNGYQLTTTQVERNGVDFDFSSIAQVVINAGPGNDTFTGSAGAGFVQLLGNGGADQFQLQGVSSGSSVALNGGAGNDTFNVGSASGTLAGIAGGASIIGGNDSDQVQIDDSGATAGTTHTLSSTNVVAGTVNIGYSQVESLTVNAGTGGDTITVASTSGGTVTTINAGGGIDAITVEAASATGVTVSGGGEDDTVTIGDGSLDDVLGPVTVNGDGGSNTLVLDDTAETAPTNVLLGPNTFTRTSGTFFPLVPTCETHVGPRATGWTIGNFDVFDGCSLPPDDPDAVLLKLTVTDPAGTGELKAWGGDDSEPATATLQYQEPAPNLNVTNAVIVPTTAGGGINLRASTGTADVTVEVTGYFTGLLTTPVSFNGIDVATIDGGTTLDLIRIDTAGGPGPMTVDGGGGDDTFDVRSTGGGTTLMGQGGDDTFVIGGDPLSGLGGEVTIDGGGGTNTVGINDAGSSSNNEYTAGETEVTANGAPVATWASVSSVTLVTGTGDDTVVVDPSSAALDLLLGDGADILRVLTEAAPVTTGVCDGGGDDGDVDVLDVSVFVNPFSADLGAGTATGFPSILNFEAVTAGSGADTLTGSEADETFTGGTGDDGIDGGGGNDTFVWNDGDGNDVLDGGTGTNRLVLDGTDDIDVYSFTTSPADRLWIDIDSGSGPARIEGTEIGNVEIDGKGGSDSFDLELFPPDLTALSLTGGSGDDQVVIKPGQATGSDDFLADFFSQPLITPIRISSSSSSSPVEFLVLEGVEGIEFETGKGDDTVNIDPPPASTVSNIVVNVASGNDIVNVSGTSGADDVQIEPVSDSELEIGFPDRLLEVAIAWTTPQVATKPQVFLNTGSGFDFGRITLSAPPPPAATAVRTLAALDLEVLTIDGGEDGDTILVTGSAADDAFAVSSDGGDVHVGSGSPPDLDLISIENLEIEGAEGDDTFDVNPLPSTALTIHGEGHAAGDSLNIDALCLGIPATSSPLTAANSATVAWDGIENLAISKAVELAIMEADVPGTGGSVTIDVTADAACDWTAEAGDAFIQIVSGAAGTGDGTVLLRVLPNPTPGPREGTVTIAGLAFTVSQQQAVAAIPAAGFLGLAVLCTLLALAGVLVASKRI